MGRADDPESTEEKAKGEKCRAASPCSPGRCSGDMAVAHRQAQ